MSIVVEDGSVVSGANSYLSLADADTYHAAHSNSSTWTSASDADKEKGLRLGTQYLDLHYNSRLKGNRVDEDQALAWPRDGVQDNEEFLVDSDEIPQKLKDACAEAALRDLSDTLVADLTAPGIIERKLVKVGPVTKDVTYIGGNPPTKAYPIIDLLMQPYLFDPNIVIRG